MQKRQDGKLYVDLHKTNLIIYLTYEDAAKDFANSEHFKKYCHIVELVACLDDPIHSEL